MKLIQKISAIALVFFLTFTIASCGKNNSPDVPTTSSVSTNAQAGEWQISYFFKNGQVLTTNFTGFKFTFTTNGIVNAANSLLNNPGTWAVSNGSNGKVNFAITYTNPGSFVPLTEVWSVDASSSQMIKLSHITGSGSTQVTDQLIFEKI